MAELGSPATGESLAGRLSGLIPSGELPVPRCFRAEAELHGGQPELIAAQPELVRVAQTCSDTAAVTSGVFGISTAIRT